MSEYGEYLEEQRQRGMRQLASFIERLDDDEIFSTPWDRPLSDNHEANIGATSKSIGAKGLKDLVAEFRKLQTA